MGTGDPDGYRHRLGNGNIVPDEPSPWPDRYALTQSHPDLAEALEIMARPTLEWPDLFNVFEIIRRWVAEKEMRELGWATRKRVVVVQTFCPAGAARPNPRRGRRTRCRWQKDASSCSGLVIEWMQSLAPYWDSKQPAGRPD